MQEERRLAKWTCIGDESAEVKFALGKWHEALAWADEAIARNPSSPVGSWGCTRPPNPGGKALLKLGRFAEARADFDGVDGFWRDFDPDHPLAAESAWWFGQSLVATGETTRGTAMIAEAQPRLAASWLPHLRPLADAPPPGPLQAGKN